MPRYIPQDLFDFAAATLAKINILNGRSIEEMGQEIGKEYSDQYVDDGYAKDWAAAAHKGLAICNELGLSKDETVFALHHYRYYVQKFDTNGKKKPFLKRIGGTWFHYSEMPIPTRIDDFAARFQGYATMAKHGLLKKDWLE
jgi:hypothetical protein